MSDNESVGDGFLREAERDAVTATKESILDAIADTLDRISELEARVERDGLMIAGSKGQLVLTGGIPSVAPASAGVGHPWPHPACRLR